MRTVSETGDKAGNEYLAGDLSPKTLYAPAVAGKPRITIRLDDDVPDWFRSRVHERGGGNYQTLTNGALRKHIARNDDVLAETLRRVIREEVAPYITTSKKRSGK